MSRICWPNISTEPSAYLEINNIKPPFFNEKHGYPKNLAHFPYRPLIGWKKQKPQRYRFYKVRAKIQTDTFLFLDMTELVCVYRFNCTIVNFNLTVLFLNEERFLRDGADHSFQSRGRQDWALSLMNHYRNLVMTQSEKV